ncbi:MAG: hypothetical protein ACKVUS_02220 [Saprospiraceae bacterium]
MTISEEKTLAVFEAWTIQFEITEQIDTEEEYALSPAEFRQRIWAAEQSRDMSLEEFFQRIRN